MMIEGWKPGRESLDVLGGGGAERDSLGSVTSLQFPLRFILREVRLYQPRHSPAVVSAHSPHTDAHDGLRV